MWLELRDVFTTLSDDSSVRCVLLSGAGDKAFSAGLDLEWALQDRTVFNPSSDDQRDGARRATPIRRFALEFQECVSAVEKCEKRQYFLMCARC